VEAGITARAILEPLWSCPADANGVEVRHILVEMGFDVVGVQEHKHGPVIGFVEGGSLQEGRVKDHLQPMTANLLIADATPLPIVLSVMKSKERTFVLAGPEVGGIVTRADLNKPPVRVYLFGMISLLEMHLTFWLKEGYPNDSWSGELPPTRLEKAQKLLADRRSRRQDTGLLECLQFCDKRDLILGRPILRDKLGAEPKAKAHQFLKRAEALRDLLAHSQKDLDHGSSWEEVIDLVEWVEEFLHRSDELVEMEARDVAGEHPDALWGST